MKPTIGMIGLGRLGLPVAVAIAEQGYFVIGYDLSPSRMTHEPQDYLETGPDGTGDFNAHLALSNIEFASGISDVVRDADIVFLAIQTPHAPYQDGTLSFKPDHLEDFDYHYLKSALSSIATATGILEKEVIVSVISTMLPGTWERELKPLCNDYMHMVYNPFFIAMGTVMRDFLNPEFVLLGLDSSHAANTLDDFYRAVTLNDAPRVQMSIPSAEATKVLYNTYISAKLSVVNTAQMVCDSIKGCDAADVLGALRLGTKRLLSTQYMWPGMGDSGGCHPRDNLALGWLMSKRIGRTTHGNLFVSVMRAREDWALYLAEKLVRTGVRYGLPIGIYGYAFKRNVAITDGSHALLVEHLLSKRFGTKAVLHDPVIDGTLDDDIPRAWLIGCNHERTLEQEWAEGSVLVDPWHIIPADADGVTIVRVG